MQIIWDAKEKVYQDYLKSGLKSYVEYVKKEIAEIRRKKRVGDKVFKRVDKINIESQ